MLFKINERLFLLRTTSKFRQSFTNQIYRRFSDKKQESYFSAIGGESDEPPPDLSPQQVNTILRTHEMRLKKSISNIRLIECNQLASNHPIEDRLRITRFHLNSKDSPDSCLSDSLALAVFDGHGGGSCADLVSRRLFHYIALSLIPDIKTYDKNHLEKIIEDLFYCPNPYHNITSLYDDRTAEYLRKYLYEVENNNFERFVSQLKPTTDISDALQNAFLRCDSDLSEEIENNLLNSTSNILLHYYLSCAVSGCCVSLVLIHQNTLYIASTGDCRVVLGLSDQSTAKPFLKTIDLSNEHNSQNISELKRIYGEHPKQEQNHIIRNERLLGQLMPLRAFGDFSFKWSVDKMKKLGLTRAFGSHIIPARYMTPPYLTCEPEIKVLPLDDIKGYDSKNIVIATDGLWDHFEASRKVSKCVHKYLERLKRQESNDSTERITFKKDSNLGEINEKLKTRAKPAITSFDEITRDDDLIEDKNCSTHLIRTALGADPSIDHQLDQYQQQQRRHTRLVTYLTLPQSVVRNFRDDISVIVLQLD